MLPLFIPLFIPLVIIVMVFSVIRSQKGHIDVEERRREIMQNLIQQRPDSQVRPQTQQRPNISQPQQTQLLPQMMQDRPFDKPLDNITDNRSYTADFQSAYYKAQNRGRDIDPWDLPPEKGPWES